MKSAQALPALRPRIAAEATSALRVTQNLDITLFLPCTVWQAFRARQGRFIRHHGGGLMVADNPQSRPGSSAQPAEAKSHPGSVGPRAGFATARRRCAKAASAIETTSVTPLKSGVT